jgi:hypothetical protein
MPKERMVRVRNKGKFLHGVISVVNKWLFSCSDDDNAGDCVVVIIAVTLLIELEF